MAINSPISNRKSCSFLFPFCLLNHFAFSLPFGPKEPFPLLKLFYQVLLPQEFQNKKYLYHLNPFLVDENTIMTVTLTINDSSASSLLIGLLYVLGLFPNSVSSFCWCKKYQNHLPPICNLMIQIQNKSSAICMYKGDLIAF